MMFVLLLGPLILTSVLQIKKKKKELVLWIKLQFRKPRREF